LLLFAQVHLTFDDGPNSRFGGELLDVLAETGVSATFFEVGYNMQEPTEEEWMAANDEAVRQLQLDPLLRLPTEQQAELSRRLAYARMAAHLVRRAVREGHYVGQHTFSHINLGSLEGQDHGYINHMLETEILRTEQLMESITGTRPFLFRPPFGGGYAPQVRSYLDDRDYVDVRWTSDVADWTFSNPRDLLETVKGTFNEVSPSPSYESYPNPSLMAERYRTAVEFRGETSVVLLHARDETIQGMRDMITYMREQGFVFVSFEKLLSKAQERFLLQRYECTGEKMSRDSQFRDLYTQICLKLAEVKDVSELPWNSDDLRWGSDPKVVSKEIEAAEMREQERLIQESMAEALRQQMEDSLVQVQRQHEAEIRERLKQMREDGFTEEQAEEVFRAQREAQQTVEQHHAEGGNDVFVAGEQVNQLAPEWTYETPVFPPAFQNSQPVDNCTRPEAFSPAIDLTTSMPPPQLTSLVHLANLVSEPAVPDYQ
jgi:peptidoglycan/xylan/chitin deacetylase (PgdA/CDA1 family)